MLVGGLVLAGWRFDSEALRRTRPGFVALLDRRTRRGYWPGQAAIATAGVASLLPALGYASGLRSFYGIGAFIPMALHTALTFSVLVVGLLCARPGRGLVAIVGSASAGGVMARRLLPAALLPPAALGWLVLQGQRRGRYDSALGVALFAVAAMLGLALVVGWNARLLHLADAARGRIEAERKAAEAELREVLAHARCVLWHAEITERPGAEWSAGRGRSSWRLRVAAQAAAQRVLPLDVPPGGTCGDAWRASRYPDDCARINQTSARALREGAPGYRQECRCRDRRGAERWLAGEVALERVEPGHWRAIGICVDVTERQASEAALREAERRSRELRAAAERQARELALLDQVRTALARELDPPGIHRAIVEATAEVFRQTQVSLYLREGDELVRQRVTGEPNDRFWRIPLAEGIIGRVARTGVPVLPEDVDSDPAYLRTFPDTVSEVCVPLMDESQVIGALNAESRDGVRLGEADLRLLTAIGQHTSTALARARLYTQARASADNLAAAQAIAHLGSWEYDHATGALTWSDEFFRIAGFAPGAFVPTLERHPARIHPEDRPRVVAGFGDAAASGATAEGEYRLVRPDGAVRHVRQRAESLPDAAGRPARRLGVVRDVTEQQALEERPAHLATHDPLTGLPNRTLLLDRLAQALARARRDAAPCAVLFLDPDRFKEVNDTPGHAAGDRLLMAVAGRLRAAPRDGDTLARLGGDEFIAVVEGVASPDEVVAVAGRLAAAVAAPLALAGQAYRVAASIGIALSAPGHGPPEELLRDADIAMYRAKAAGGGGHALFDPAMQAALVARVVLERDLRVAEVASFEAPRVHGGGRLRTFPDGWRVLKTIDRERVFPLPLGIPVAAPPQPVATIPKAARSNPTDALRPQPPVERLAVPEHLHLPLSTTAPAQSALVAGGD